MEVNDGDQIIVSQQLVDVMIAGVLSHLSAMESELKDELRGLLTERSKAVNSSDDMEEQYEKAAQERDQAKVALDTERVAWRDREGNLMAETRAQVTTAANFALYNQRLIVKIESEQRKPKVQRRPLSALRKELDVELSNQDGDECQVDVQELINILSLIEE